MRRALAALALCAVGLGAGALAGYVAGGPTPMSASLPRPAEGPPVVVLVVGCTLRRDQIGVYGGHPRATPFLDGLAASGARFDDAVAAAPWTRAASTALLTGHHAIDLGMVEPGDGSNDRALPERAETLAEALDRAGFHTVGITANPNLNEGFGFGQGFDRYEEVTEPWSEVGMVKVDGTEVVDRALAAVDASWDRASPLFLQAVLVDAHEPRHAPEALVARLAGQGTPPRVALYQIAVRRLDDAVRALDEGLRARGLGEAWFVVVSDHGEGLLHPFHHGKGHGTFTYPSTVAMPWLVRGPGIAPGTVVEGVASGVDVKATLLDLLGVEGDPGSGLSWAASLRGAADAAPRDVAWVDTWFQGASRAARYDARLACHLDADPPAGDAALRPPIACYDRATDPDALEPLEPLPPEAEALRSWRAERVMAFDAREAAGTNAVAVPVDAALRHHLEALGYVEGSDSP